MASNVENALGTEQRFSPNPQGTYEKRLGSLPVTPSSAGTQGSQLAQALGLLGNSIMNEGQANLERQQKYGVAEAERLIEGSSEEDLKKYRAIDLLNAHGQFELADNPYAVATIEKWRGKYFGAMAQANYEQVVAQDGYAKTADAEAARYDSFIKEQFPQYAQATSQLSAFTEGYYDNHIPNMLQQAKNQIAARSKDLIVVRDGNILADIGRIAQDSLNLTPDEVTNRVQKLVRGAGVTALSHSDVLTLAKSILEKVAQESGSPDKVKALRGVELYTEDGKPVLMGSVVDDTDALQTAVVEARRNNVSAVMEQRAAIQKLKPEEITPYMEDLKKKDPTMYQIVAPEVDTYYHNAVALQQRQAAQQAALAAKSNARSQVVTGVQRQLYAYLNHQNTDGQYPVATSLGGLPKYEYVDAKGNIQHASATAEDVYGVVQGAMMDVYRNPNLSPQQKAQTAMQILSFGPGEAYAKAIKSNIQGAFDTATTQSMVQNMDMGSVRSALEMYEADPGTFGRLMGPDLTTQVQTIRSLRDLGKSDEDAMAIYVQGRDNVKNPTLHEQYAAAFKAQLKNTPSVTLKGMDGNDASIQVSGDNMLESQMQIMSLYLQGAGYSADVAQQMAQAKLSDNYWSYNGHVFPKAWFADLNVDDKGKTANDFLDHLRQAVADMGGIADPANVFAMYNPVTDRIEVKGNGVSAPYDRATFITQANQWAYDMYTQGQAMQKNNPLFPGQTYLRNPDSDTYDPVINMATMK